VDYPLFKGQLDFMNDRETNTIFWIGGRGNGKSHCLGLWCLRECMEYPGCRGIVVSSNNPQLRQATIPDFLNVYEELGVEYKFDKWLNIITFENGSTFKFQSLDVPAETVKGGNLWWMAGDEIDGCPEEHIRRLKMAVRHPKGSRLCRFVGNSPPPKHWVESWVYDAQAKERGRKGAIAKLMQSTTFENTLLPKDVLEQYLAENPPGTADYRRWIMGEMGVPLDNLVFNQFENRHVIPESKVPWDRVIGFVNGLDLGFNHKTVFLRGAYTSWDELYIFAEHSASGWLLREHARRIEEMLDDRPPCNWGQIDDPDGTIYCDHDLQDREELKALGIHTVPAVKKDMAAGIDAVNKRFKEDKLFIVESECPRLLLEIPYYVYHPEKDEPVKKDDHACDALRYLVGGLDLVRDELEWSGED